MQQLKSLRAMSTLTYADWEDQVTKSVGSPDVRSIENSKVQCSRTGLIGETKGGEKNGQGLVGNE